MNLAIDRQAFTDQSQSMNLFISNPDDALLTTVHLYGWEQGLKTGQYYLRREQISSAQQFTVKPVKRFNQNSGTQGPPQHQEPTNEDKPEFCTKEDPDCLACQG
jgi:ribonucleotide reductase alpha subunit